MNLKDHIMPIFIIIVLILLGYYQLFFGGHFYTYKDQEMISAYSYGNSIGNGWRPDKGFGISFFFGDPGKWHPWSPLSFWEKLFNSPRLAYIWSIVILDILAAISLYFLLRFVIPNLGKIVCLLSVVVVFGTHQATYSYNRAWITLMIGTSLLSMLLYDYYKHPKISHFFMAVFLFWFVIFFGNFYNFTRLISLGLFFSILYYIYFRGSLRKFLLKFGLLFLIGIIGTVLIGFGAFYSIVVDYIVAGGYMREKMIVFPQDINLVPNIKSVFTYIISIFQIEWLPVNLRMIGIWPHDLLQSFNILPVFPLVLTYFIFYHTANFWEFSLKWLLIIFYLFTALCLMPVFNGIYSFIDSASKTIVTMYDVGNLFPFQIVLIGIFIYKMKENNSQIIHPWGRKIQKVIALLLLVFYSGLTIFCFFALFAPSVLPSAVEYAIEKFRPEGIGIYPKDVIAYIASSNINLMEKATHWYSLAFFLLSTLLILPFLKNKWFRACAKKPSVLIAGILAINGILLSWTMYPLNKSESAWDKIASALTGFKPTDRFYFTDDTEGYNNLNFLERLAMHKKRAEEAGGLQKHLEYKVGIYEPPALNLSSNKSFMQKNVGEFLYHIFNGDGIKRIKHLRDLTTCGPMLSSEMLDMGAVSYYYSTRKLIKPPKNLSLYVETDQLYIYKNLSAWPYFYLADNLGIKEKGRHLNNVQRETAYLEENDFFKLPKGTGNSNIELKEFSYGQMVFDYYGDKENFLVVADAWHPFWKGKIDGLNIHIVKANEIFKGVKLPPGRHTLTLFFDTSPFFAGVYVSAIAWVLFLGGFFFALKFKAEIPCLKGA